MLNWVLNSPAFPALLLGVSLLVVGIGYIGLGFETGLLSKPRVPRWLQRKRDD